MTQARENAEDAKRKSTPTALDAIALLTADHRQIEALFERFQNTESAPARRKLAAQICDGLRVHMRIEEEVFYPACRDAGISEDLMDEADVEHDTSRKVIAELEAGSPGDDHWDARVKVLCELIEHHVKEEEKQDGLFARAKTAGLDLNMLGAELDARKNQLARHD